MGTTASAKSSLLNVQSTPRPPTVLSKNMTLRDLETFRKELLGLAMWFWAWGFLRVWHGTCFYQPPNLWQFTSSW